jgi:hypothetical protein
MIFHFKIALFYMLAVLGSETLRADLLDTRLQDLTITIPGHVRGLMGVPPGHKDTIYHLKGINFITSSVNGVHTKYSTNFSPPPSWSANAMSDPFKIIEYLGYLQKQGDTAGVLQLVEPTADKSILPMLTREDVIKSVAHIYGNASGLDILLAVKDTDKLIIYYSVRSSDGPTLQMDELDKIGPLYYLRVQQPKAGDVIPVNIFTALYGVVNGTAPDVTITP